MIRTTLSRNQSYEFLCMGAFIERADMTTRTLDIAADILLRRSDEDGVFDIHIWMEILKAQNAVMMYRVKNGPRSSPRAVMRFLVGEEEFPRSIKHCVDSMEGLVTDLPRNEQFIKTVNDLGIKLDAFVEQNELVPTNLRMFFDDTQKGLNELHSIVANTWFLVALAPEETQNQTQEETA